MLSTPEMGCIFWPLWVSPRSILRGALDPLAFKPFLSRSFVVCSTCLVDIFVRKVIKCSCCMRWRFDIWQFFQIAQSGASFFLGGDPRRGGYARRREGGYEKNSREFFPRPPACPALRWHVPSVTLLPSVLFPLLVFRFFFCFGALIRPAPPFPAPFRHRGRGVGGQGAAGGGVWSWSRCSWNSMWRSISPMPPAMKPT